jgi:hypothetical protein
VPEFKDQLNLRAKKSDDSDVESESEGVEEINEYGEVVIKKYKVDKKG